MFGGHVVQIRSCVTAGSVVFNAHGMSLGWWAQAGKVTGICSMHGEEEELAPGFGASTTHEGTSFLSLLNQMHIWYIKIVLYCFYMFRRHLRHPQRVYTRN